MRNKPIINILILIFFAGILLKYFVPPSIVLPLTFQRLSQIAGVLLFIQQINEIQSADGSFFLNPKYKMLNIILGSMLLGTTVHFIYYSELSLSIAYGFTGAGVSLILVRRSTYQKYIRFMMIAVFIIFVYLLLTNVPARDWGKGSENHVSVIVLFLVLIYLTVQQIDGKQPSPFWATLGFLFCLYAQGRGGILAMLILLSGILIIRYTKRITSFGIALLTGTILYLVFFNKAKNLLDPLLNRIFDRPLLEDPRMILNLMYIDRLDREKIIFGSQGFGTEFSFNLLGLSTHNSFLSMHATYGIFLLPIFSVLIWLTFNNWSRNSYMALFLITILLRSISDTIIFTSGIELTTVLILIVIILDRKSHKIDITQYE